MNKSELKVEITREEFENFKRYKSFYYAFRNENKESLVEIVGFLDDSRSTPYKEVYYCKEALDKIESIELSNKQAEIDELTRLNNILKHKIDKLKERSLVERILNK